MTDRDTFAAAALTGLVAGRYDATATVASRAYNLADAVLRERERNGAVAGCETVTLTDAEREAIAMAASACDVESSLNVACNGRQSFADMWSDRAGVLRSLLERLK
jgi:hypothetical protein